jgi:hypothetical protein
MKRAIIVLSLLPGLAAADEILLKNGGKLTGQVVSEDARMLVVEVGPGRVSVPVANVLRIERGQTTLSVFRDRASRLSPEDVQGWLGLGFWALERDLVTQAHEAFVRVLRLDPQNAAANTALGRVQQDGRWMSADDAYRARGYVRYEGEWMTPVEHEARLRARTAEAQAAAAQREGELRAREAEARARQAEAEARRAEAEAQAGQAEGGIPLWGGWGGGTVVYPPILPPPTTLVPPIQPLPQPRAPRPQPNPRSRPVPPQD